MMQPNIEKFDQVLAILPSMATGIKIGAVIFSAIYLIIVLKPYWDKYVALLEKRHLALMEARRSTQTVLSEKKYLKGDFVKRRDR
jgi:hypothetical protein